ncbi:hypothetical protein [Leucobacter sp. 7(1)]|uniref:hypothetical protein n=1 Tax=Leucobacter sp. 7(1) TaxID=1255613 RepID=UPI000B35C663|nr:hypothetical protein [Leucobacter sp. 7(1)]
MSPAPVRTRVKDLVQIYLVLLPLSALATFFLLVGDRFTAHSPGELAHASYGWPLDWVTQDLSRYAYAEFPQTVPFNFTRAWDDPIATSVHWQWFAGDMLIVGFAVTAAFLVLGRMIRHRRAAKPQDSNGSIQDK